MKKTYNAGNLPNMLVTIAERFELNPAELNAFMHHRFPEIKDKSTCPNCQASMDEYVHSFDYSDACLLMAMARDVRRNLEKRMNFTEANSVHVPTLPITNTARCRTTWASKLGLVVKTKSPVSKRSLPSMWTLTSRGWKVLGGELIPKTVRVWRNKRIDNPEGMTTIGEVLHGQPEYLEVEDIKRMVTYEVFGQHQGSLL